MFPLFLFAVLVILGFFPVLQLQVQVNHALQYAARMTAVSCQDPEEDHSAAAFVEGQLLFRSYLKKYGWTEAALPGGISSISLLRSDCSGDYILLAASYQAQLPISFWKIDQLPVEQCVRMKKWTGADPEAAGGAEEGYVYVTPTGSAYHSTSACSYLKLSTRSVSIAAVQALRNQDGSIYDACSCFHGESKVYITDYGTEYHGDLSCSSLKRTICKIPEAQIGNRHACAKCCP